MSKTTEGAELEVKEAKIENKITEKELLKHFAEILKLDIANGDARKDTIEAYKTHLKLFLDWYREKGFNLNNISIWHIKKYRKYLLDEDMSHTTISLKLTTLRRFFAGLKERGVLEENPAEGVSPPRNREAKEKRKHLTPGEVELLVKELKKAEGVKGIRDRAMISLMLLEGWRVVEVHRANRGDIDWGEGRILTRGKGKNAYIYPREDTVEKINKYLEAIGDVSADEDGVPLFINLTHSASKKRISRGGIRSVVNGYMEEAGIKQDGLSCHSLRYFCGSQLFSAHGSQGIKVVMQTLRHSSYDMAAQYAFSKESKTRYTEDIPVSF